MKPGHLERKRDASVCAVETLLGYLYSSEHTEVRQPNICQVLCVWVSILYK